MSIAHLGRIFENPPNEYRIAPLLRINDTVDRDEIRWQVRAMKQAGCGGTFTYCERMSDGLPDEFLSPKWWEAVRWTAEACAEEGLDFWVYDDEDWPSGRAGDQLVKSNPDWAWHYLGVERHDYHGPAACDLAVPSDGFVAAVAYRTQAGKIAPDTITKLEVQSERLTWNVPEGDWSVAVYRKGTGPGFYTVGLADLMNGEAMAEYVKRVYEGHRTAVAGVPGLNFVGYFTDEPCGSISMTAFGERFPWFPSLPYTPELPARFEKIAGVDFVKSLPMLHEEADPAALRLQLDFWKACAELLGDNYFGKIESFCADHGLEATGHLNGEEQFHFHLAQYFGDLARMYRYMHTPGIDWIVPLTNELPAVVPKYAASSAHLLGRKRAWCESFAGSGWGLSFEQMRAIVNWEHVNGIGFQIPISYKYSLRGANRATFYNPGVSYQQPYWDHFKAFADYEARLCALVGSSGHVAQVVLAYPGVAIQAHAWDHDTLNVRSLEYNRLGNALRFSGFDFDILDDDGLAKDAQVGDGALVTSSERYTAILLPTMDAIRRDVAQRCLDYAKAGGTVVAVGTLPRHSAESGADDPALAEIVSQLFGLQRNPNTWHECGAGAAALAADAEAAVVLLQERLTPEVKASPAKAGLVSYHRSFEDGHVYLLMNRSNEPRTFDVAISAHGYPEIWNPITGAIEAIADYKQTDGELNVSLSFGPQELIPLVVRLSSSGETFRVSKETIREISVEGPFKFSLLETMSREHLAWNFAEDKTSWASLSENTQAPVSLPLGDWSEHGLRYFSGIGVYETEITLEPLPEGANVILDLGKVSQSAEVFVNERPAGLSCLAPFRLDITKHIQSGKNTLRIQVANTLSNYYAQFKELADAPVHAGGDTPERRVSGLLGPVKLIVVR